VGSSSLRTTSGLQAFFRSFEREVLKRLASKLTLCTQAVRWSPIEIAAKSV
jgi:hypothetical protein